MVGVSETRDYKLSFGYGVWGGVLQRGYVAITFITQTQQQFHLIILSAWKPTISWNNCS